MLNLFKAKTSDKTIDISIDRKTKDEILDEFRSKAEKTAFEKYLEEKILADLIDLAYGEGSYAKFSKVAEEFSVDKDSEILEDLPTEFIYRDQYSNKYYIQFKSVSIAALSRRIKERIKPE